MKVFLSWSGENSQSHQVAIALHTWLPRVIQQLDPFLSSHDIDSGINWSPEVDKQLSEIHFGVLAITRTSMLAPWLLFEAGALSKHVNRSYVCPYLFGIKPTDLDGPLSKLQSRESHREGTLKLLETINKALPANKLTNEVLSDQFEVWWPKLEAELDNIKNNDLASSDIPLRNVRSERELLEELLTLTRKISRDNQSSNYMEVAHGSYHDKASGDQLARLRSSVGGMDLSNHSIDSLHRLLASAKKHGDESDVKNVKSALEMVRKRNTEYLNEALKMLEDDG